MPASSTLIKSLEDIMRKDPGLNGDAQYIEQITWLLFLKVFDAKEKEWELNDSYQGTIPVGYRWRDWAENEEGITGDELIAFVEELFKTLKELDVSDNNIKKYVVKNVFENINNYMKSGIYLRLLINRINERFDFISASQKHAFNELYEGMLKDLQSAGRAGEFYTPRPVTNFMVEAVNPKLGERILDPACGTGGFLISSIAHFGKLKTPQQYQKLQRSVFGWEKKPLPYLLAMTNLLLHDIENPSVLHQNSLSKPVADYMPQDQVDVVFANPPYGGSEDESIKQNFPADCRSGETADLFVVLIMHLLKDGGRCGIVLPDGFMFGDGTKANIKKQLLEEFGLHTIVRLPAVFEPYTNINTNLLFFQKGIVSEGVWFYRLDYPEGVKSFTKTKPMQDSHFDAVRQWWQDRKEIVQDGFDKARFFTKEELENLNYDFDKCCPFPHEEEVILEPKELIEKYQIRRKELGNDIDWILGQIASGLADEELSPLIARHIGIEDELTRLNTEFPEQLRKSILQQAVQGKLVPQNPDEGTAEELLKRIRKERDKLVREGKIKKEKPLPEITEEEIPFEIPESWVWVRAGDIFQLIRGITFPSTAKNRTFAEGLIPCATTGSVQTRYNSTADVFVDKKYVKRQDQYLHTHDIIMSTANSRELVGKTCIWEAEENKTFGGFLTVIRSIGKLDSYYAHFAFIAIKANGVFLTNATQTTNIANINLTVLSNTLFPLPPLAEQKRIVKKIKELLPFCDALKQQQ